MEEKNRPLAFIAMKFDSNHWRDKRYMAIREEVEEAGFRCLRGDEINTSGSVVDEVCRLLRDADLVIIDSSGDSQNVSYEIGYCHGFNRTPDKTLLLRSEGTDIPFNYRHFRHRVYKDLRHLRRLVRDYLNMVEPIPDNVCGYTFTFRFSEQAGSQYILHGAICIFNALKKLRFSGRAECYSAEQFTIPGRFFSVGVILRRRGNRPASIDERWWESTCQLV